MPSEMPWQRPRGWLVCLCVLTLSASTGTALREPARNLTLTSDDTYRDCSDIPEYSPSGVYLLQPGLDGQNVPAYCDMDNDGGYWTVALRRDDIVPREDFYRDWESYKLGLGGLDGEFYWGNEYLFKLTSHLDRRYQMHIWLQDFDGNTRYALYQNFVVESEATYYRLLYSSYSGTAGDSLYRNNNHSFSTYDSDNDSFDGDCAERNEAAWWFEHCSDAQLTGKYYPGGHTGSPQDELGINWLAWKDEEPYSLKAAIMKIKPSN